MSVWEGIWRSSNKAPQVPIPLGARSAGRARGEAGWTTPVGTVPYFDGFWTIEGEGCLQLEGEVHDVGAGDLLIYEPGQLVKGWTRGENWAYRWFTCDGDGCGNVLRSMDLRGPWPRQVGRCPVELFDQLEEDINDLTSVGEYRASATLYRVLTLAATGPIAEGVPSPQATVVERCRERLEQQFTDPTLDIATVAEHLHIHRSRLTRLFHERFGMPPGVYLQRLRLRKAMNILRNRNLSVKEIAFSCGFRDASYFSRRLVETTGMTPTKFRKTM